MIKKAQTKRKKKSVTPRSVTEVPETSPADPIPVNTEQSVIEPTSAKSEAPRVSTVLASPSMSMPFRGPKHLIKRVSAPLTYMVKIPPKPTDRVSKDLTPVIEVSNIDEQSFYSRLSV